MHLAEAIGRAEQNAAVALHVHQGLAPSSQGAAAAHGEEEENRRRLPSHLSLPLQRVPQRLHERVWDRRR